MNYSDFGVTCAEDLEQDEWSLTKPTFETPKGGVLTVVGIAGKSLRGGEIIHLSMLLMFKGPRVIRSGVVFHAKIKLSRRENSVWVLEVPEADY